MPHVPPWHVAVPFGGTGQTLPHAPQFCVSLEALRHWFLHARKPALHVNPQAPEVHTALPFAGTPHPEPHAPQLFGSDPSVAQLPLQSVCPAGQVPVHEP
jgi:hypothetical protein